MFATVKHEQKELKINPNCYIGIIYDYIREHLSIPSDREFDLHAEDGSACFISRHAANTDGRTILKPRQTYVLEVLGSGSADDEEKAEESQVSASTGHGSVDVEGAANE